MTDTHRHVGIVQTCGTRHTGRTGASPDRPRPQRRSITDKRAGTSHCPYSKILSISDKVCWLCIKEFKSFVWLDKDGMLMIINDHTRASILHVSDVTL
jgi:hypothetical protein